MSTYRLICGEVTEELKKLKKDTVDCIVTSPPYYQLRDYSNDRQIGLESTPEEFVEKLVGVLRECRRVLKINGTCWINIGDSYSSSGGSGSAEYSKKHKQFGKVIEQGTRVLPRKPTGNIKPKDLIGVPWMLAFALRNDGWYLRDCIIWAKGVSFVPNYSGTVMPESVEDRCTKGYEFLFMLTKNKNYYADMVGVREKGIYPSGTRAAKGSGLRMGNRRPAEYAEYSGTRNLRNVWCINTEPSNLDHFASYPKKLVEPCILISTSNKGYCNNCGKPWIRIIEKPKSISKVRSGDVGMGYKLQEFLNNNPITTKGWKPTCNCNDKVIPGTVLDPFCGSGTTGVVALSKQRNFIGIDLNSEYLNIAHKRIKSLGSLLFKEEK